MTRRPTESDIHHARVSYFAPDISFVSRCSTARFAYAVEPSLPLDFVSIHDLKIDRHGSSQSGNSDPPPRKPRVVWIAGFFLSPCVGLTSRTSTEIRRHFVSIFIRGLLLYIRCIFASLFVSESKPVRGYFLEQTSSQVLSSASRVFFSLL
jgi:hypothetical protein